MWAWGMKMSYKDRTPERLFPHCLQAVEREFPSARSSPLGRAMAWLLAVNTLEQFKVLCRWFDYLQADEAQHHYPDPDYQPRNKQVVVNQAVADLLVAELDADFLLEYSRFPEGRGPEFSRLPPHARIALLQELATVAKSLAELEGEAHRGLKAGEHLPPRHLASVMGLYA